MDCCLRTPCTIVYGFLYSSSAHKLFNVSALLVPQKESANIRVNGIGPMFCGVHEYINETRGVEMYGQYTVMSIADTLLCLHFMGYVCIAVTPCIVDCCLRCFGVAVSMRIL